MEFVTIDVLSAEQCAALIEQLRAASGDAATVYGQTRDGGTVNPLVRKATRLQAPDAAHEIVVAALQRVMPRLAEHFATPLSTVEPPQFLRYGIGDYFVAHQDGNTPLIRDDSRHRRVSAIVFLSDARDYEGGALVFHGDYRAPMHRVAVPNVRGSIVAFRSEQTHEVTPLTAGERFTIATWYR